MNKIWFVAPSLDAIAWSKLTNTDGFLLDTKDGSGLNAIDWSELGVMDEVKLDTSDRSKLGAIDGKKTCCKW